MKNLTVPALVLGLAFILGMWTFGSKYYGAQKINRSVSVKGLAEQVVTADQGAWTISAGASGNDLNVVKSSINRQTETIKTWLKGKGFASSEITVEELSLQQNIYGNAQQRYTANLRVSVATDQVDKLQLSAGQVNELFDQGVILTGDRWSSRPRYYFTRINEIKPELLAKSIKAALRSAEEFAENSGAAVGDIKNARQGIISLIPSTRVSESEEFYPQKIARVVSSMDYYIE